MELLEKFWSKCGNAGVASVSTPFGMSFFDMSATTPREAFDSLCEEYCAEPVAVTRWLESLERVES